MKTTDTKTERLDMSETKRNREIFDAGFSKDFGRMAEATTESLEPGAPPSLPAEWVKVDNDHLPNEDDICIVWARQKEFAEGLSIAEAPWELPDLMLTRGWWVIENSNTLIGAAERQAKARFFDSVPWTAKMTSQALYFAVLKEADRLHGWESGAKPFRKIGEQPV